MILGKKTFLIKFNKKHFLNPKYLLWLNDPLVTKYIGRSELKKTISLKNLKNYYKTTIRSKNCIFFAIYSKKTNLFIGTAKIKFLVIAGRIEKVADLGLMIGERSCWGQGYGTDALQALSRYAFKRLNARKLTGGTMGPNKGMIKAFLKVGFKREGCLKKQIPFEGNFVDHILFGLIK